MFAVSVTEFHRAEAQTAGGAQRQRLTVDPQLLLIAANGGAGLGIQRGRDQPIIKTAGRQGTLQR